jgi:uncharacterized circularly permuted ATP-grasp superfamily protein
VPEDNVRTPFGISCVLENRDISMPIVPALLAGSAVLAAAGAGGGLSALRRR